MKRYPMKLKAAVFENIWGGTRLMEEYGIKTDKANAAEAWMLSCNKDGYSVIENGDYAGKHCKMYLRRTGQSPGSTMRSFQSSRC